MENELGVPVTEMPVSIFDIREVYALKQCYASYISSDELEFKDFKDYEFLLFWLSVKWLKRYSGP